MMVDMLPFPRVISNTPEEQIGELINYLILFKETLEFALANISTENLSPDLVNKLNELGANIEKSKEERENEFAQISSTSSLTVSDVCSSDLLKATIVNEVEANLKINVNYETGHLEYTIRKQEG